MTLRSAARAITAPAPAATPLTAAMIGIGSSRILCTTDPVIRVNSSSPLESMVCRTPMISLTSPPEQNPRPDPVTTSTETSPRWGSSNEEVAQVGVDLEGQGVELLGAIEDDGSDAIGHLESEVVPRFRQWRRSPIWRHQPCNLTRQGSSVEVRIDPDQVGPAGGDGRIGFVAGCDASSYEHRHPATLSHFGRDRDQIPAPVAGVGFGHGARRRPPR